ncbi:CRISPR-associated endonuclease Cas1 [Candidatus Altiarchaeales archaeon WOR_SM1_SCG]|nr:CRISPR-associated endonuclease Cas1 [Candidatus Altiarchaeales archaeon WOR_SM1_SCG]
MQLVINTYGSYLRKKNNCFLVKNEDTVFEVSVNKVDSILITTSAYLSTDAVKFAVDNNIDIVFLDHFGDPYGRVWHSKLGSTTLIRRRQLEIYDKPEGLKLAKNWASKKIGNQVKLIKKLKSTRSEGLEKFQEHIDKIEKLKEKLSDLKGTVDERRADIMGLEGMASRIYFEAISSVMPERFKFSGRSRNPAIDEFNCLLNYGYGVLYSRVEKACIIAGLDPYIGFIHTDNYNKKSLVFDLIEMFRIYADKTVIYLFSKRKVKEKHFDEVPGGLSLNKEGKAILIEELNKTFEKKIKYRGREIKVKNIIPMECHRIANELIKK